MAQIVTITNPLTGQPAQVDKLDHTAQEIDDAAAMVLQLSNPNILDNWYFVNPVNQRGKTEYSGNSYCIDRWFSGNNKVTLEDDGLLITSVDKLSIFRQYIEFPKLFSGRTVTFSVDSEIVSGSWFLTDLSSFSAAHTDCAIHGGITSYSFPVNNSSAQGSAPAIGLFSSSAGSQIKVHSIKLELGSQQTLAHQDANGNWVLNEIPDYGEQLARCQRYYQVIPANVMLSGIVTASNTVLSVTAFLSQTMRTTPTVSIANFTGTIIGVSSAISAGSALTSVAVAAASPVTSVRLSFNSNTSLGSTWRPAALQLSSPILLSADL